jgi:L-ascorbate metabolism protein UlaG (beta-lactamase superfamily)
MMEIQLLRHATLLIRLNGKTLLVDPMLSDARTMAPIINSPDDRRNPLVELPGQPDLLAIYDAVLLTHMHRDHFDDAAAQQLSKAKPIVCQPEDVEQLKELGFLDVCGISEKIKWAGMTISRTGGRHGTGDIGRRLAPVSGYVLETELEPSLYITGDTIYCSEVEQALEEYQPKVVVVNAGAAQFIAGGPITMTADDVQKVCNKVPAAKVIAIHMEAINHCLLSREDLRAFLTRAGRKNHVLIPADGERVSF